MEVLVVVDMQNDFIDGSLGTKEAVSIVPKVADKIKNFKGLVLATRDTHEENYLNTQEGTNPSGAAWHPRYERMGAE